VNGEFERFDSRGGYVLSTASPAAMHEPRPVDEIDARRHVLSFPPSNDPKARSHSIPTSSTGILDKGEYEGANGSVVDERIRGNYCAWEGAMRSGSRAYALTFGRTSTNRCPWKEGAESGQTNPLMDDPEDGTDRT